jgi:hypothetical protein
VGVEGGTCFCLDALEARFLCPLRRGCLCCRLFLLLCLLLRLLLLLLREESVGQRRARKGWGETP